MEVSRNEIMGKLHGIRGLLPKYTDLVNKYNDNLEGLFAWILSVVMCIEIFMFLSEIRKIKF